MKQQTFYLLFCDGSFEKEEANCIEEIEHYLNVSCIARICTEEEFDKMYYEGREWKHEDDYFDDEDYIEDDGTDPYYQEYFEFKYGGG